MLAAIIMIIILYFILREQKIKDELAYQKDKETQKIRKEAQQRYQKEREEQYQTYQKLLYEQTKYCMFVSNEYGYYDIQYITDLLKKYSIHLDISLFRIEELTFDKVHSSIKCALLCEEHLKLIESIIDKKSIVLPNGTAYDAFLYELPLEDTDETHIELIIQKCLIRQKKLAETKILTDRLNDLYQQNIYLQPRNLKYKYPESISDCMIDHLLSVYSLDDMNHMSNDQLIEIMKVEFEDFYVKWKGY